jgi:hypothetical protein
MSDGKRLIDPVRQVLSAPRWDRCWVANVRRDPRVALIVHDASDYLHYVSIRGRAAVADESEDALTEAMRQAERYGEDAADFANQPRLSFRIDPESVHEYH